MSGLLPTAVYGLEIPAGAGPIPSQTNDFPGSYRITMAAIDPSAEPIHPADMPFDAPPKATLKLIRVPIDDDDSDESDDEDIEALLNGDMSDESSDDEANGGPSDPSKSKRAKRAAGLKALKAALENADDAEEDEEMEDLAALKLNKGKAVASGDEEDEDSDEGDDTGMDEFVICTLDPTKNYQQPLDITIGERESVYFKVSGTHTIFLTGNYIVPFGGDDDDDDERDYDLSPDDEELYDEESDDLDDLGDPRITEVDSEDEQAPKLIAVANGNTKKRTAEQIGLDEMIKADKKESGKQKKQKSNSGEAVPAVSTKEETKKSDKKVQFAKNLEQGPTPSGNKKIEKAVETKTTESKKDSTKKTPSIRTVQGVHIDDRKEGSGPAAKKGQKVSMRYIGKLNDGKVFDSNKKGTPFRFTLGAGEVIKGWDIGVEGMRIGGERRIKVPANLAYGKQSVPGIPKNSELTFDLKLLELK